ncbi:MAG: D-2-hydroxyacid dehydrogenase family protein [Rhodospirillales bacterium]
MRCAIIDDYQDAALNVADWGPLKKDLEVVAFRDHLADEGAVAARLKDFEIVCIMRERTPFGRSLLEQLPKLKLLVTSGLRNAAIDMAACKDRGIVVAGTESLGYPTAELTWGLILGFMRSIPHEDRTTRAGGWQTTLGIGCRGKTLGVIGLGRLGGQVAAVGKTLGMDVLAWSQNLTPEKCAQAGVAYAEKDELLAKADVITIHLILSGRTRGLIGAREFGLMKPTALFVNTSRGPIVDEAALVDTLRNRRIGGAALDVFDVEPLPGDHPLRRMENTVITPHLGYVTKENYQGFFDGAVKNIRNWLDGKPVEEAR